MSVTASKQRPTTDGAHLVTRYSLGSHCLEGRDKVLFAIEEVESTEGNTVRTEVLVHAVGQRLALYRIADGTMSFFSGCQRNVTRQAAMSVSPNKVFLAVCEAVEESGRAQVSIYNVGLVKRTRTMSCACKGDFISCSFSGDGKLLVTAGGEPDNQVVIWQWQKQKVIHSATSHSSVSRISFNPSNSDQLTTSGLGHLRLWYATPEGAHKVNSLMPTSREQDHFADHTWLKVAGGPTRMIAITDGEGLRDQRGATVMVFETCDRLQVLELRQTLKVQLPGSTRLETLAAYRKGFVVAGGGVSGFLAVLEHTDDQREPYMLVKTFTAKGNVLTSLAVNRSSELLTAYSKTDRLLTFQLGNIDIMDDGEASSQFHDLVPGGSHVGPIVAMDVCLQKPLVVTVGTDRMLRVWNYLRWRTDVVYHFNVEEPTCVTVHPSGLLLSVGFKDRVVLYNVLMNNLRQHREISAKNCRAIAFSNGGHLLAFAAGFSLAVYQTYSGAAVYNFAGHIGPITTIQWSGNDSELWSTGADGNVYGWDLSSGSRLDDGAQLNRCSAYHALVFQAAERYDGANVVLVAGSDSALREISWKGGVGADDIRKEHHLREVAVTPPGTCITAMVLSISATTGYNLICGTSAGAVRAYDWPLTAHPQYDEVQAHSSTVTALRVSPDHNFLFSCAEDGTMFVHVIAMMERGVEVHCLMEADPRNFSVDSVLASQEEIEEQASHVAELKKMLEDQKSEHEYALHRKQNEWMEEMKIAAEKRETLVASKDALYEELSKKYESTVREHQEELEKKDQYRVQVAQELESQYEHQLAGELDRFDRLSEEMEAVQQRCEGLLEAQRAQHASALKEEALKAKEQERSLVTQTERLQDDKNHCDQMYKEVLNQLEEEYEQELQHLMAAAEAELSAERENTAKLRVQLQAHTTKEDQLKKRMQEITRSSNARDMLYMLEKGKREKLEATMHHFEQHMHERELTLAEKEKIILDLRSNNMTLDNFRFVLDHRLQQLMEERGPITDHIEGLEVHIRAMYDELVKEFTEKKEVARVLEQKEQKNQSLSIEVNSLRALVRSKEQYIFGFKRDLSSMVHIGLPKELEQAVKNLYKRFVQGEQAAVGRQGSRQAHATHGQGPAAHAHAVINKVEEGSSAQTLVSSEAHHKAGDDSDSNSSYESSDDGDMAKRKRGVSDEGADMIEQAREAHRQREFMEKRQGELRGKLASNRRMATRKEQTKLAENATLIKECNLLRKENIALKRTNDAVKQTLHELQARCSIAQAVGPVQPQPQGSVAATRGKRFSHQGEGLGTTRPSEKGGRDAQGPGLAGGSQHAKKPSIKMVASKSTPLLVSTHPTASASASARGTIRRHTPATRQGPHSSASGVIKGSTLTLHAESVARRDRLQLERMLDENQRDASMQRSEVGKLRKVILGLQQEQHPQHPQSCPSNSEVGPERPPSEPFSSGVLPNLAIGA